MGSMQDLSYKEACKVLYEKYKEKRSLDEINRNAILARCRRLGVIPNHKSIETYKITKEELDEIYKIMISKLFDE